MKRHLKLHLLVLVPLFLVPLCGCKISQLESNTRSLNRDLDLVRSPYQFKVAEDKTTVLRYLRKMPVGETAADAVLRADIEKAVAERLNAPAEIAEIRIFETQPDLRRELWVAEHEGKRFAFDVLLVPTTMGRVNLTIEGPEEIHGSF